jgi:hypothetical protein
MYLHTRPTFLWLRVVWYTLSVWQNVMCPHESCYSWVCHGKKGVGYRLALWPYNLGKGELLYHALQNLLPAKWGN